MRYCPKVSPRGAPSAHGQGRRQQKRLRPFCYPSGGQGRYLLHMGIGLLHICNAVRFLHGGGVTNLTIYTNLSHAAKLPPKLSAQPVTEKLESAIIGVTANPHCRQLQEREPDEPNNSKRCSPCAGWRTGIAAGCLRQGAAVDRKSTRLNSSHNRESRMPSSA